MNSEQANSENLFVYGTLMDPGNFKIITGKTRPQKKAILHDYHKIDLRRAYPFIVPREGDQVEGYIIMGVNNESFRVIDKYEDEGKLYFRKKVNVYAAGEPVPAYTYVGNLDVIWQRFEIDMEIHERIERYIEKETQSFIEHQLLNQTSLRGRRLKKKFLPFAGRAQKEFIGRTVKELVQTRLHNPDISVFTTRYGLEKTFIPSLDWLKKEKDVFPYINSYIKLISKQVLFNQIEDRLKEDFPQRVAVKYPYYENAVSALASFEIINSATTAVNMMFNTLGIDQYRPDFDYHDYLIGAIFTADEIYDKAQAKSCLDNIHANFQEGAVPLGVELEFSNIGHLAINSSPGQDPVYDSFYYFNKFDLTRRFWKLGGYIDDHGLLTSLEKPGRGFLELALGRYKLVEDTSVPTTADPWLLAQLIKQAVKFMDIKPHSLHISIQVPKDKPQAPLRDPQHLLCLLMLGGDLQKDYKGILRERRIQQKEIINIYTGLTFSRLNYHRPDELSEETNKVVEFQFPRLFYEHDYEPLIVALKGFQQSYNPEILDLSRECPNLAAHKETEKQLLNWAENPQPVPYATLREFLNEIGTGLENERETGSGQTKAYIKKMLSQIEKILLNTNTYIKENT